MEMTDTYKIVFGKPEGKERLRETVGNHSMILKRVSNKEYWIAFSLTDAVFSGVTA
jgi:hypothetical protein